MPSDDAVAYVYETRNIGACGWHKTVQFNHPDDIDGLSDLVEYRNVRPLVEAGDAV